MKLRAFVLLLTIVVLVLSACAPAAEPTPEPEPTKAEVAEPTKALEEEPAAGDHPTVYPRDITVLFQKGEITPHSHL